MAPPTFTYDFKGASIGFKGKVNVPAGLFINNEWVDCSDGKTFDLVNPATGKNMGAIACATEDDVDKAVKAAQKAYDTAWGLKVSGAERGKLLNRLADLIDANGDELAALESLNNGKAYSIARGVDVTNCAAVIRYYAGWADKIQGKTIETDESMFAYTRHEPIGVVGQICPWNFPVWLMSWKIGPALATGNTIVFKPSEFTPLTALRMCELVKEAGFPPGVLNCVAGLGNVSGAAISAHMDIQKVAFTGSTAVGRAIMKAAAESNLKRTTLELGGKSPTIVLEDADLEQAVSWGAFGISFNHGQTCCAGSRIFVHEKVYDKFMPKFTETMKAIRVGNPFEKDTFQGPQVSQIQYDRIMGYIASGKEEGATCHLGGERHGNEGFFIQPTIFTDTKPGMKIVQEEIFGPVAVVIKFKDDDDLIKMANDTLYGLASSVFSRDISRALKVANSLQAGTVWVNCHNLLHANVPFGGFKQSGLGRELGEYALENYTEVKSVKVNLSQPNPL